MTAIALQHRDSILSDLAAGKRLSDIAPVLGVSVNALSKVLKNDPDYRAAIESSFDVRIDKAEDAIQDAQEQVDVSRARAYHDALKWRSGVECSKFLPKQQIEHSGTIQVDHTIKTDASSLLKRVRGVANTPAIESVAVRLDDHALHNEPDSA